MEKEKLIDDLYDIKEAYCETIHHVAQCLKDGEESLADDANADFVRDLVSGLKSTLIDIGMLEGGGDGYAWDENGSMRGGMRGSMRDGSRDGGEGSMRRGRGSATGRFMRAYDGEGKSLKQRMQDIINEVPDEKTRMDMQRMMDQMQSKM